MFRSTLCFLLAIASIAPSPLPAGERSGPGFTPSVQAAFTRMPAWRSFLSRHGDWAATWNERTGTPQRAYGPAVLLPGYAQAGDDSRKKILLSFLADEREALGIDPANLRLRRSRTIGDVRYVSFVQTYLGAEVLFSEVELRVHERGTLMAVGVVYYSDIDIPSTPVLDPTAAAGIARRHLGGGTGVSVAPGDERPFVLPADAGAGLPYRLVFRFAYRNDEGTEAGDIYIDARDGGIARVDNGVTHSDLNGSVAGRVQHVLPTDADSARPFPDLFVLLGTDTLVSDPMGLFTAPGLHQDTLTARLRGRWIYVSRVDTPSAKFSRVLTGVDTVGISWTDSNSHVAERNVYYHSTAAHNLLKGIDTAFTGLDYPLPAAVNLSSGSCNAFWNGTSINFYAAGPGCVNAARSPAMIYHEYAHAVNDRLYAQAGAVKMYNKIVHEGTADAFACLVEDSPLFARGFWGPGSYARSLDNTLSFPVDLVGQDHRDGQILGGALWDLRTLTTPETARRLAHLAKWGVPDDPQYGAACAEWFVEILVADDDDGDLGNGTPHFAQIESAFNRHGIGTTLFFRLSFTHTPYPATLDTSHNYVLAFSLSGQSGPGGDPGLVIVRYSTDNLRTLFTAPASKINPGSYLALIPPQPPGTMVSYFIQAYDSTAGIWVEFPAGAPSNDSYGFLVGPYATALLDDLESPGGWKGGWRAGVPGDDATAGMWEWGRPQATFNGWRGVQPGENHSATGVNCFVTGAAAGPEFTDSDVDGGRTTLLSPVFDLSGLRDPVIRYHRWYSNNLGTDPRGDRWKVDISGDGGATWAGVEDTDLSSNFWRKVEFKVSNYVTPSDSVMLRFIAADEGEPTLVEALVDDLEILTTNAVVLPVDDARQEAGLPGGYSLGPNYPNPFNGGTVIPYALPRESQVKLTVYDLLGREAATLVDGPLPPGRYEARWEPGHNPAGVYFYRLSAGTFGGNGRLIYLK